jgi:hypothetical protein
MTRARVRGTVRAKSGGWARLVSACLISAGVVVACSEEPGRPSVAPRAGKGAAGADAGAGGTSPGGAELYTDPKTNLTWEVQPRATMVSGAENADQYCAALEKGGFGDFRLPRIDELRTLVVGCSVSTPTGACDVREGCLSSECDDDCDYCSSGCYLVSALAGPCNDDGVYISSSPYNGGSGRWILDFEHAAVTFGSSGVVGYVRCVRGSGKAVP